jgi:hypothetical protein
VIVVVALGILGWMGFSAIFQTERDGPKMLGEALAVSLRYGANRASIDRVDMMALLGIKKPTKPWKITCCRNDDRTVVAWGERVMPFWLLSTVATKRSPVTI